MTAILIAKLFPHARAIGVEPMPANYAAAVHNIHGNGVFDRVKVLHGALTGDGRPVQLHYDFLNSGGSSSTGQTYTTTPIDVQSYTVPDIINLFEIDCD